MSAGANPSLLSEYYPTTSSSLVQHTHLRVLWLPLSVCFLWSGETLFPKVGDPNSYAAEAATATLAAEVAVTSPTAAHSPASSSHGSPVPSNMSIGRSSFFRDRHAEAFVGGDETMSGYEAALRRSLTLHPPVPAAELNWTAFAAVATPPDTYGGVRGNGKSAASTPAAPARAPAYLPFFLTSDLGTSHWENMDNHRATVAVVVVVNAAVLAVPVDHAVDVVTIIFASQFKDKVCRCVVVDPPPALAEKLSQSSLYVCVSESVPMRQTAERLLSSVAQSVVDAKAAALKSYSQPDKVDNTVVRTPVDKPSALTATRNAATLLASRLKKKAADALLQFGAVTAAIAAYGETQFNSNVDCLWCSATVESIAAARYRHLQTTLLCHRDAIDATVVQLQSDNPTWGPSLTTAVNDVGVWVAQYGDSVRQTLASFRSTSVPHSMRQRLVREVEENVSAQTTLLKGLLVRVRVCLDAGTWEVPSDPQSYRLGSDVKRCVENVLRLAFTEVDIYLRESLRQLGKCAPAGTLLSAAASGTSAVATASSLLSGGGGLGPSAGTLSSTVTMLRKRELETRFKRLELLAAREARQPFLDELSTLRSLFPGGYGAEWTERTLLFFAYLCMMNGAERRARALLVEFASIKARLQRTEEAAEVLLRVCTLAGIGLPLAGLRASSAACGGPDGDMGDPARWTDPLFQRSRTAKAAASSALVDPAGAAGGGGGSAAHGSADETDAGSVMNASMSAPLSVFSSVEDQAPDRGVARLNLSISNAALLNVPLLLRLMEVFEHLTPATATAALRCQLATLLLFNFPHLLDKATQQGLQAVVCEASAQLEPQMSMSMAPVPFFLAWEALPLPPHLAPKTVPVGGALFTFIDTQRLKLTILCLNGKKLGSRTVWTVGDVASVLVTLYNPFHVALTFEALALRCRSCAALAAPGDAEDSVERDSVTAAASPSPLPSPTLSSPISYVLSKVEVFPQSKRKVLLQVQPTEEGTLLIDGVTLRLADTHSSQSITGKLPAPMYIPVLQRLPQVSCTLSTSELEVFGSQCIHFTVRVVNCGRVPISCISLTAHSEQCQLEGCEGCKERRTETDTRVSLNKRALDAAARTPLQPGDVVMIPGTLEAPPTINKFGAHYVLFRTDLALPHPAPGKPKNVPDAVPVYAVIPRRVTETRLRLFHSPGVVVTSVSLTKDRRAVEVRVANRSRLYSMELQLSSLAFAELPDAFIVAGAEYVVPPIKLTRIPPARDKDGLRFVVPWVVRELPRCAGTLELNLSLIGTEVVSAEPLDECMLTLDIGVPHSALPPAPSDASTSPGSSQQGDGRLAATTAAARHPGLADGATFVYRWESGGDAFYGGSEPSHGVVSHARPGVSRHGAGGGGSGQHPSGATGAVTATAIFDSAPSSPANGVEHFPAFAASAATPPERQQDAGGSNSAFLWRRTESMDLALHNGAGALQRAKSALAHLSGAGGGSGVFAPGASDATPIPIVIPAVTPIRLCLRVAAPRWRRAIRLHVRVSIDSHFDVAVLTGAVQADAMVGEEGRAVYEREFELFAFKTGEHLLHVIITDDADRELTHTIHLVVEHSRIS